MPTDAMAYNESHVCDVALSPTRAKGHVAERRAAAPRSPSRPAGAAMHIRAVIRSCVLLCISFHEFHFESVNINRHKLSSTRIGSIEGVTAPTKGSVDMTE